MLVSHKKPLYFTHKAWIQMWKLTKECPTEISAMGLLVSGTTNLVQEFFVPEQRCSGVETTMDEASLSELCLRLTTEGYDLANLCVWWHSHVNMATKPSGTDENNIDRLANGRILWSIITNKNGADRALLGGEPGDGMYIRMDMYDPVKHDDKNSVFRMSIPDCAYGVHLGGVVSKDWVKAGLDKVTVSAVGVTTMTRNGTTVTTFGGSPNSWGDADDRDYWGDWVRGQQGRGGRKDSRARNSRGQRASVTEIPLGVRQPGKACIIGTRQTAPDRLLPILWDEILDSNGVSGSDTERHGFRAVEAWFSVDDEKLGLMLDAEAEATANRMGDFG